MSTDNTARAVVTVRYKNGVLDPQGATIQRALTDLGMNDIQAVRTGRTFELTLTAGASRDVVEQACKTLLANPVIESYEIEMPA